MIYLVRHGLDDERFIGGYSDVKLLPLGIEQIDYTGRWLREKNLGIQKIYTSDILRAKESALVIAKYLDLDVYEDVKLREQNKGILNGMDRLLAEKMYPEYLSTKDVDLKCLEGESLRDLYLRIKKLLLNIDSYNNCLLVTHRGVINMIYYLTYGYELDMNKDRFNVSHGSVHEFDVNKSLIRRIK